MKISLIVIYGQTHKDEWDVKSMIMYVDKSPQLPVEKCYWTENNVYCMVT